MQTWAGTHYSDDPTHNAQYRLTEGLRKAAGRRAKRRRIEPTPTMGSTPRSAHRPAPIP